MQKKTKLEYISSVLLLFIFKNLHIVI